jgi:reductive dehalogenase
VADRFKVQPEYRRFDQRFNMTRQTLWNPPMIALRRQRAANLQRRYAAEAYGYTLRDYAYDQGARANLRNTRFQINRPNHGGNAWDPLHPRDRTEFWTGSPVDAGDTLRKVARLFGADAVGFCLLDRRWVYSHYYDEASKQSHPIRFSDEPGYEGIDRPVQLADGTQVIPTAMRFVAVLLFEMDAAGIRTAPTATQMATTNLAYSRIAFTTVMLAEFLRGLGYHAIPSANCTALSVPLAIEAGLGQLGRHGKLITPRFGPRCRIAKVITDLPLPPGAPIDFGVAEFCTTCRRCAERCPAGAIPTGDRSGQPVNECNSGGYSAWHLDHKRCYRYWAEVGTNCGICVAVCPYNDGGRLDTPSSTAFWDRAPSASPTPPDAG